MLRYLYDRTLALAAGPHATKALCATSFAESSFFPIPPDVVLIPMVLADRRRWAFFALLCTVTSVLGGIFGYFIGMLAFEQIAKPILDVYGYTAKIDEFIASFNRYGWWIVFIAGLTPFPYKVITIASGAAGLSFPVFMIASVVSRGLRFFVVAGLLYLFGPPIRDFVEKRLALVFTVFVALVIAGFAVARFAL